ncbi:hypothetical protein [Bacillus toyonensis]|uniref:hypothetical protein n=1 Tax=Bacillus toyonensis TaxID=155322 RepID=UPI002E1AE1F6|nr:hypothetical protein [Bacillus toyonensis]
MRVLLAQREYVYYYLEHMYCNLRIVEIDGSVEEFIRVAKQLDFEVLASGDLIPPSPSSRVLSIREFADLFFEIRKRNQVVDEEREQLDEYCSILEEYLSKK